jgi:GNAT superfamily N-acetyltransferase
MPQSHEIIRQFEPGDAGPSSRLVRDCLALDPSMSDPARERLMRAESPEVMRERAGLFYMAVAVAGNNLAGVAGIDLNEIRILYVHPGRQRQGIGSALLRHLEAMVPAALFSDIFVYSSPDAAGFYRAHGYESHGEHLFLVGEIGVPTIFMRKPLGGRISMEAIRGMQE